MGAQQQRGFHQGIGYSRHTMVSVSLTRSALWVRNTSAASTREAVFSTATATSPPHSAGAPSSAVAEADFKGG